MIHRAKTYSVLLFLFSVPMTVLSEQDPFMPYDGQQYNKEQHTNNIDIECMEEIFSCAPQEAQDIVDHLKDPNFLRNGTYRYAIFVGKPGTGKTETANAIGFKMQQLGWHVVSIGSGDIVGYKRNETTVRLRDELAEARSQSKPIILIIDELNELLEHSENDHYDTSTTSKYLWNFVDSQERNHNHKFFMIGTMNRDTKLPQPFKNRIVARRIEFTEPTDPSIKRKGLHSHLVRDGVKLESDVNDSYLDEMIQQCKGCDFRYLREVTAKARIIHRAHNRNNDIVLSKNDITQAFEKCAEAKIAMHYNDKEETEEERQERHFVQRVIIENLVRHCQETHYAHDSYGEAVYVTKTWQTMSPECIAALDGLLSDDQQRLAGSFNNRSEEAKENKKHEIETKKELEQKAYNALTWNQKLWRKIFW